MTASMAAWERHVSQISYASPKAGAVEIVIVAARDLAKYQIRVATIAPETFYTQLVGRLPPGCPRQLRRVRPTPEELVDPAEFGSLAAHILENAMIHGEAIRLDGSIPMTADSPIPQPRSGRP